MQFSMQKLVKATCLMALCKDLKHNMCAFLHAHIWGSCFHSPLGNWKVSFQECIAHLGGSRQVTT